MTYERVIETQFISTGAERLARDQEKVKRSFSSAGRTATREGARVKDWAQKHKLALGMMAVAAAGIITAVVKSAPSLMASLAEMRLAFSLLMMDIGENVAPMMEVVTDLAWRLYEAWGALSPETQTLASYVLVLSSAFFLLAVAMKAVKAATAGLFAPFILIFGVVGVVAGAFLILYSIYKMIIGETTWFEIVCYLAGAALVVLGLALLGVAAPILLVVGLVIVLVGALVYIFTHLDDLGPALKTTGNFFKWLGGVIWDFVTTAWKKIADFFVWVAKNFSDVFTNILSSVGGWLTNVGGAIKGGFLTWMNNIKVFFISIVAEFRGAGVSIIQGLIDGIKSMASALNTVVTDVVGSAVSAVTGFLGIASPSKVFADIGRNMGAGLELGIERASAGVGMSVDHLVNLPSHMGGASGLGLAPPAMAAGGGGGTNIDIGDINIMAPTAEPMTARTIEDMIGRVLSERLGRY